MTGPVAILIGPPGAGKTTVGRLLAGLLEAEFLDTDDVVEEAAGKPVSDIFISDGEAVFRGLEREAVARHGRQPPGDTRAGRRGGDGPRHQASSWPASGWSTWRPASPRPRTGPAWTRPGRC